MKKIVLSFLFLLMIIIQLHAQSSGIYESYAILSLNGGANAYYDMSAATPNPDFQGANLGSFMYGTNTLVLKGGQNKTYKCAGCDITGSNIYYRVYPTGTPTGSFTSIPMGWVSNDAGGCGGNQTWEGTSGAINVIGLLAPGGYTLEVYSDAPYANCGTGTNYATNGGANYKATFTVTVGSNPIFVASDVTPIPTAFANLGAAFTAINNGVYTGNIAVGIYSNSTEATSAVLNASGTNGGGGTSSYTAITISPQGGAARTVSGAITGNLIDLNGADNVTINGLNTGGNSLIISNTATGTANTIRFIGDATANTITNCNLQGSASTASNAVINFSTGTTTGNDGNTISNCDIGPAGTNLPINGIFSLGTSAAIDNSGITINNNRIFDFFNAGVVSAGINISNTNTSSSSTWAITNNKLYQTAVRLYTTASTHQGISVGGGAGYTITGNIIGFANASGTGTMMLVGNTVAIAGFPTSFTATGTANATRFFAITGAFAAGGATSEIQGNTIANIAVYTSSGSSTQGALCGINVTSGNVNIGNTTPNTIGATSGTGSIFVSSLSTGAGITGIYVTSANTVSIQNNNIGSIESSGRTAGTASGFTGIRIAGAGNFTVTGNNIGNATASNIRAGYYITGANLGVGATATTATGTSAIYGIDGSAAVAAGTSGNIITVNSNIIRGIYVSGSATTVNAISLSGTMTGTTPSVTINNNQLGTSATDFVTYGFANSGALTAISTTNTVATTHSIQNNDIRGIVHSAAGSNAHTYITATGGTAANNITTISGNTFTNLNVNTTGSIVFINHGYSMAATATQNINNNSIVTAYNKTGAGGSITIMTSGSSSVNGSISNMTNNNFSNITVTGAATISGISNSDGAGSSPTRTVTGNTFNAWTGGTSAITVMSFGYIGANNTFSNNTITNITGQAAITGITLTNSYAVSNPLTIANNTINNLSSTGTGGAITGIICTNASPVININNNIINNLSTTSSSVVAISAGSTTTTNIYTNKIYQLSASGATSVVSGIAVTAGTAVNVYNNIIGDLSSTAYTSATAPYLSVAGINNIGGAANLYNNTVYIGAVTSSGANASMAAVYWATANTLLMQNNLLVNLSTPKGSGAAVAFLANNTTLTNYAAASNNNSLYGTTALFWDGTNTHTTLSAYTTAMGAREQLSLNVNPTFASTTGSNANYLHFTAGVTSALESGGTTVALTNPDFDGNTRPGPTGSVNGGAAAWDIGADEFDGIPVYTCATPTPGNTVSTANGLCYGQSITLSLQNATTGTGVTYQWQSSTNGISYSNISGATSATYTVTPMASTYYRAIVTCGNGPSSATSTSLQITFANNILTTTPASRCGTGTVNLAATGNAGTITWYTSASGGTAIGTGSPFTTPSISNTTTYWAATEVISPTLTGTIGTGTTLTGATSQPTAFCNRFSYYRMQTIYTAAELTSAGLSAGNITALAYNITTLGDAATNANHTIKIGTTASSVFSSFVNTGLSTVYGPATYTHAVGVNTVTLATPFYWDGVSNIIVEVSHDGANMSNNAQTYYTTTASNMSGYTITNGAAATTTTSRLNTTFTVINVCASPRTSVIATVNTAPSISASVSSPTICQGQNTTLSVSSSNDPNYTYVWTPGTLSGASQSVSPAANTTYTVNATDNSGGANNGCQAVANVNVTVNNLPPTPTINPNTAAICLGGTQTLALSSFNVANSPSTFGTGTSVNGTTSFPNPLSAYFGGAKHQLLFTKTELEANSLMKGSIINTIQFELSAFSASACTDFTIRMGHTSNTALSGFVTGTTNVYGPTTFTPSAAGYVTFTLTTPFTWNGVDNLVIETVHNAGNTGNGSGTTSKCTATAFNSVYYGAKDNVAGGVSSFDALTSWTSSGTSTSRPNIKLAYTNPTFVWSSPASSLYTNTGATTAYTGTNLGTVYAKPSASETYTVTSTATNGCTSSNTVSVTVNPLPTASISGATVVCQNATSPVITFTGAAGTAPYTFTYKINGGSNQTVTTTSGNSVTVSVPTTTSGTFDYSLVSVSDFNTCSQTQTGNAVVTVNALPTPSITAGGATTFCAGGSVSLDAGSYSSYAWNATAGSATSQSVTANATGTYSVTVTDANNCTAIASQAVTVNALPTPSISAGGATTFCSGGSVSLDAGSYSSYAWNATAGSATSQSVTANATGTYSVTVTDANNCTAIASQAVTVNALPTPSITAGGATTFCSGGSVSLDAGSYSSYAWNATAGSATSQSVTASATGTYSVTVTDANNCTAIASQAVTVNALPTPSITAGGATTFCSGGSVSLDAGSYSSYAWNATAGNATSQSVTANATGTYSVTVTDANNCTAIASQVVTVNALPTPSITAGGATTFCSGGSVSLDAGSYSSYAWNATAGNATSQSVTASATGTYSVTVTDANGCTATASQAVTANALPTPSITAGGATTFCAGGSVSLDAGSYSSYAWNATAGSATSQSVTASATGTYSVTVTDANGCTAIASQAVTVNALPTLSITAGGATTFCAGGSVSLDAGSYSSYAWNATAGSATSQSVTANATGTYSVTVTDANGCTAIASQAVTVNALPTPSITAGGATTFCAGGSVSLDAGSYSSYAWNATAGSATSQSVTANATGTYSVTVTDANNCTATTSQAVTVNPVPVATITTNNGPICANNDAVFALGGTTNAVVTYNFGGSNTTTTLTSGASMLTVSAATSSQTLTLVSVTDGTCSQILGETSTVTVNALPSVPTISTSAATTFCSGNTVTLTSSYTGGNVWSNAATTDAIIVSTSGNYSVTYTDANGCSATSATNTVAALSTASTTVPTAAGTYYATNFCTEGTGATAWTYFYANDKLLLGLQMDTWNPGTLVQSTPGAGEYQVRVDVGNSSVVDLTSAPYNLINGKPWKVINRTWDVQLNAQSQEPVSPVNVRTYFTQAEYNDINASFTVAADQLTSPSQMTVYKLYRTTPLWGGPYATSMAALTNLHAQLDSTDLILYNNQSSYLADWAYTPNQPYTGIHTAEIAVSEFSGGGGGGGAAGSAPFSVELAYFDGHNQGSYNLLNWVTISELSNKSFEVQRSFDGISFQTIGTVNTKAVNGTSSNTISYEFVDMKPAKNSYYRLKQMDIDGSVNMLPKVVEISLADNFKAAINLFPNPATNELNVAITANQMDIYQVSIHDIYGKLIADAQQISNGGTTITNIDVRNLAQGTYIVMVKDKTNNLVATERFVKE